MTSPSAASGSSESRRLGRANWPVRRYRLGEEPSEDLSTSTTATERLAMMWPLAVDAFSHGGRLPERTPRATWPVKIRKLSEPETD
jgi:hypothetical protein